MRAAKVFGTLLDCPNGEAKRQEVSENERMLSTVSRDANKALPAPASSAALRHGGLRQVHGRLGGCWVFLPLGDLAAADQDGDLTFVHENYPSWGNAI